MHNHPLNVLYTLRQRKPDMMLEAWKRVRANKGAAGVDGQDFEYIENEIGICMSSKGCVLQMITKLTIQMVTKLS